MKEVFQEYGSMNTYENKYKEEAFEILEKLCRKVEDVDEKKELEAYRDEKYEDQV